MNPTSLVSRLPQELIDKVIQEHGADDPTLRSCSLVCRAFLQSSQACIFSYIELIPTPFEPSHRSDALLQLFLQSPHICRYVRSLRLVEGGGFASPDRGRWVSHSTSLVAVLWRLDGLRSFAFEAYGRDFAWYDFGEEQKSAICGVCQRTSLIALQLSNMGGFRDLTEFSLLVASPALRDLKLKNISLPSPSEGEKLPNGPLGLTQCSFNLARSTLDTIMTWFNVRESFIQLQNLALVWDSWTGSRTHLRRILSASKSTLLALDLTLNHDYSSYILADLAIFELTSLRFLGISFLLDVVSSENMVPWLAGILGSHRNPSSINGFVVRILLLRPRNPSFPTLQIDWDPLASVLSTVRFPLLRNFELDIVCVFPGFEAALETLVDGAKRGLGDLDEIGILKCQGVRDARMFSQLPPDRFASLF
ncbi:hypothetical protein B0H11DRAFT_1955602 [Mycena galericulata]|nr:hypothetical protein B0H11DRAFT_1955602 [Mycena galericulata]